MAHPRITNRILPLLEDWRDLPEETTPVKRTSLQTLETRIAEWIYLAEAGIRKPVKEATELETLPAYKEAENEAGDVAYAEKEKAFYAWNGGTKVWEPITSSLYRATVTKHSELAPIPNAVNGDIAFVTETNKFYYYLGAAWNEVTSSHFRGIVAKTTEVKEPLEGDLVIATGETEQVYLYKGGEWNPIQIGTSGLKNEAVTAGKIAPAAVTGEKVKVGTSEVAKELKAGTEYEPSATASTTVYLSLEFKPESTVFEVIADGKPVYKFRKATIPAGGVNVNCSFRLKAKAKFEVKVTEGKLETEGTSKSVYVVQEG